MKSSEFLEYSEKIRIDPSLKGALPRSFYRLIYQSQKYVRSEDTLTFCKENIQMAHVVMITRKDFYLIDALNKKIELLKQSGLIEFWRLQYIDVNFIKAKIPNSPQAITIQNVLGSIYILVIGYLFSIVALFFELVLRSC